MASVYFYHPDHLGSSSWITGSNGQPVQHIAYMAFGEEFINQKSGTWSTPYTFTGSERDAESGYNYMHARYYISDLSIFPTCDPMSDMYPSLSPYAYCANNPMKLIDPNGEEFMEFDNLLNDGDPPKPPQKTDPNKPQGMDNPYKFSTPVGVQAPKSQSSQTSASQTGNKGGGWGISLDVNISVGAIGYSAEIGYVKDASGNGSMFYSHGTSAGFEASIGANYFFIPNSDFKLNNFEGQSMSTNISTPYYVSGGILTDHSRGAEKDYYLVVFYKVCY